jgi:hypothetical protein
MTAPSGSATDYDRAYEKRPDISAQHAERLKARRHMVARYGKARWRARTSITSLP